MGKLKTLASRCPGCLTYYEPKESRDRVAVRVRVAGRDLAFCPSCLAGERYKLEQWLVSQNKSIRSLPLFDPRTKRKTLVILTDTKDYEDVTAEQAGELMMPTEKDMKSMGLQLP